MPSAAWSNQNPKITVYLDRDTIAQLKTYKDEAGFTSVSLAAKHIVTQFFAEPNDSTDILDSPKVQPVLNALRAYAQHCQLDPAIALQDDTVPLEQTNGSGPSFAPNSWMTSKDAYAEATKRGYSGHISTFKRHLSKVWKSSVIHEDFERLGMNFDAAKRRNSNPKDKTVTWIRFAVQ